MSHTSSHLFTSGCGLFVSKWTIWSLCKETSASVSPWPFGFCYPGHEVETESKESSEREGNSLCKYCQLQSGSLWTLQTLL